MSIFFSPLTQNSAIESPEILESQQIPETFPETFTDYFPESPEDSLKLLTQSINQSTSEPIPYETAEKLHQKIKVKYKKNFFKFLRFKFVL